MPSVEAAAFVSVDVPVFASVPEPVDGAEVAASVEPELPVSELPLVPLPELAPELPLDPPTVCVVVSATGAEGVIAEARAAGLAPEQIHHERFDW